MNRSERNLAATLQIVSDARFVTLAACGTVKYQESSDESNLLTIGEKLRIGGIVTNLLNLGRSTKNEVRLRGCMERVAHTHGLYPLQC